MSTSLIKCSLVLFALLMVAAGAQAYPMDVVDAKVPFDFVVNGRTFHPGTYEIRMNAAGGGVMSLRGDQGKAFAFVSSIPAGGHDPAGEQPALVFSHRENQYVLTQIWAGGTEGRQLIERPAPPQSMRRAARSPHRSPRFPRRRRG